MKSTFRAAVNHILSKSGYSLIKNELRDKIPIFAYLWTSLSEEQQIFISPFLPYSKSQFAQDLFVLSELSTKAIEPFFVEFGATDGVQLSNTFLLEKRLGWKGILSEPARVWHDQLSKNRACAIDHRCVTDSTGSQVEFLETGNPTAKFSRSTPELSGIAKYADSGDWASKIRVANSKRYLVDTVSLNHLLSYHTAPRKVGYLSMDTEGSELLILQGFDFDKYAIQIITVEHNYNSDTRRMIYDLLTTKGYVRKHAEISGPDDWYTRNL